MAFKNGALYFIPDCSVSRPVKDKFVICISAEDNIFYLVNSCDERRPYIHETGYVVYIEKSHFAQLDHRSYINIRNIKNLSSEDLGHAKEYSIMPNNLWLKIKAEVSKCRIIQEKYKEIIERQKKFR